MGHAPGHSTSASTRGCCGASPGWAPGPAGASSQRRTRRLRATARRERPVPGRTSCGHGHAGGGHAHASVARQARRKEQAKATHFPQVCGPPSGRKRHPLQRVRADQRHGAVAQGRQRAGCWEQAQGLACDVRERGREVSAEQRLARALMARDTRLRDAPLWVVCPASAWPAAGAGVPRRQGRRLAAPAGRRRAARRWWCPRTGARAPWARCPQPRTPQPPPLSPTRPGVRRCEQPFWRASSGRPRVTRRPFSLLVRRTERYGMANGTREERSTRGGSFLLTPPIFASLQRVAQLVASSPRSETAMSVLGIDVGNATSVVGLARRNGIDVVLNSESKRETPSMVNFASKQVSRGAILLPSRAHVARLRLRRRLCAALELCGVRKVLLPLPLLRSLTPPAACLPSALHWRRSRREGEHGAEEHDQPAEAADWQAQRRRRAGCRRPHVQLPGPGRP